jgi:hypothetical protein
MIADKKVVFIVFDSSILDVPVIVDAFNEDPAFPRVLELERPSGAELTHAGLAFRVGGYICIVRGNMGWSWVNER